MEIKERKISSGILSFDEWAFINDYVPKLEVLSKLALKEIWHYGKNDPGNFPILKNYLYFTYYRLKKENKISENGEYGAFDTGLVDVKFDSIYAIFRKSTPSKAVEGKVQHKYIFERFSTASDRKYGRILWDNFNPLPKRANYFANILDKVYDTAQSSPQLSDEHIIIDNIDRLPTEFISNTLSRSIEFKDTTSLSFEEKQTYLESLREALRNEERLTSLKNMRNRIDDAIVLALKRTDWNFKTAIPVYYPRFDKMSMLLPLALVKEDTVDVALLVDKLRTGAYRAATIFTLQMAYKNARLVSRPDSDWLTTESINEEHDDEDVE